MIPIYWGVGDHRLHTDRSSKIPNGLVSKWELVIVKLIRDHSSIFWRFVGPVEVYVKGLCISLYSGSKNIHFLTHRTRNFTVLIVLTVIMDCYKDFKSWDLVTAQKSKIWTRDNQTANITLVPSPPIIGRIWYNWNSLLTYAITLERTRSIIR